MNYSVQAMVKQSLLNHFYKMLFKRKTLIIFIIVIDSKTNAGNCEIEACRREIKTNAFSLRLKKNMSGGAFVIWNKCNN